jgi:uncharacterized surface protein with fasciclin (FAS1) repeats
MDPTDTSRPNGGDPQSPGATNEDAQSGSPPAHAASKGSTLEDVMRNKGGSPQIGAAIRSATSSGALANLSAKYGRAYPPGQTLLQVTAAHGSFAKFGEAIERAGLVDMLQADGPFTVFAPTDRAFERLPAGKLEHLFDAANRDELVSVLNYHFLRGRRCAADLHRWQLVRTVHGQPAPIKSQADALYVDGALVRFADIEARNGILHGIHAVLIPMATVTTLRTKGKPG